VRRPPATMIMTGMMSNLLATFAQMTTDPWLSYEIARVEPMMELLAREYEEGASNRVQELRDISALLQRAAGLSAGRSSWTANIPSDLMADLRISALETRLDVLRNDLIEMQAWLEVQPDEDAATLLRDVFAFEYEAAQRRASIEPPSRQQQQQLAESGSRQS